MSAKHWNSMSRYPERDLDLALLDMEDFLRSGWYKARGANSEQLAQVMYHSAEAVLQGDEKHYDMFGYNRENSLRAAAIEAIKLVALLQGGPDDVEVEVKVLDKVRSEYLRAYRKHEGNTPFNPEMSDDDRTFILFEEIGEVARALTPDADTEVGHGGDVVEEAVQVTTMLVAWLSRILKDKYEEERDE